MSNPTPPGPVAWSIERIILLAIVVGGAIGVLLVVLQVFHIGIPDWVQMIGWILFAVLVGAGAVKLIFQMLK
jgi:hypothetical protein